MNANADKPMRTAPPRDEHTGRGGFFTMKAGKRERAGASAPAAKPAAAKAAATAAKEQA